MVIRVEVFTRTEESKASFHLLDIVSSMAIVRPFDACGRSDRTPSLVPLHRLPAGAVCVVASLISSRCPIRFPYLLWKYSPPGICSVHTAVSVEGLYPGLYHGDASADNICNRIRLHDRLRRVAQHPGSRTKDTKRHDRTRKKRRSLSVTSDIGVPTGRVAE